MATSRQYGGILRAGNTPFKINDENLDVPVMKAGKQTSSSVDIRKTPAASTKPRRVLGDISNRKPDRNGGTVDGKSVVASKTKTTQRYDSSITSNKKVEFRDSNTQELQESSRPIFPSNIPKSGKAPRNNFALRLEKPLIKDTVIKGITSGLNTLQIENSEVNDSNADDSYDAIRPAGRTWAQQIANGDLDDDDSSDVSLEGANTVFEDHAKFQELMYENHRRRIDREGEEASEYVEQLLAEWMKQQLEETISLDGITFKLEKPDWTLDLDDDFSIEDVRVSLPDL